MRITCLLPPNARQRTYSFARAAKRHHIIKEQATVHPIETCQINARNDLSSIPYVSNLPPLHESGRDPARKLATRAAWARATAQFGGSHDTLSVKHSISIARRGKLLAWVPECFMAALTDILHSTTDVHEQHDIFGVASPQRFQAENLQRLSKGIKTPAILNKRGYLSGLQLNARNLRFGSNRSASRPGIINKLPPSTIRIAARRKSSHSSWVLGNNS